MAAIIAWIQQNTVLILSVLLGLSETLALIPSIKSNSIFQMIVNVLKSLAGNKPAA